jgi:hypothetical protein
MFSKDQLKKMSNEQLVKAYRDAKVSNDMGIARNKARAELVPNAIEKFKSKLDRDFVPSNIGELSKVFWGFTFVLRNVIVEPGQSLNKTLNISEDASFAVKEMQKTIFTRTGAFGAYDYNYLDSEIHDDNNLASGLSWSLQDLQSKRVFMDNALPMEFLGDARQPTKLKKSYAFLPDSNLQFTINNSHPTRTYVVNILLNGIRIRLPNEKDLNSLTA